MRHTMRFLLPFDLIVFVVIVIVAPTLLYTIFLRFLLLVSVCSVFCFLVCLGGNFPTVRHKISIRSHREEIRGMVASRDSCLDAGFAVDFAAGRATQSTGVNGAASVLVTLLQPRAPHTYT